MGNDAIRLPSIRSTTKKGRKMGKFLEKFKGRFLGDIQGAGGCETCGYGADEGMSEEEFDKLMAEIDKWVEDELKPSNAEITGG